MRTICFVFIVFFVSDVFAYPALTADETRQLKKGEVVVRTLTPTDNSGVSVRAFGVIHADPSKVWPVVRDCQYFKEFMPRTMQSQLVSRTGDSAVCYFKIDMPFPFDDLASSVHSTEKKTSDGAFLRSWTLIAGSYRRNNGSWEVRPWSEGKSLLVYFIDIDPKVKIPDDHS